MKPGSLCPVCAAPEPCAFHPKRAPFVGAGRSSDLYTSTRWRRERREQLAAYPSCVDCGALADTVDHEPPHRGDVAAFFDRSRYRSMCRSCHQRKTTREIAARVRSRRRARGH